MVIKKIEKGGRAIKKGGRAVGKIFYSTYILPKSTYKLLRMIVSKSIIRKARENDFNAIFEMYFDKISNRFLLYNPMDKKYFKGIWKEMTGKQRCYVCEKDGEILGFISYVKRTGQSEHIGYISPIVVKRGYKGLGVGRKLMRFILRKMKEDRIKRAELVVNADNTRGIRLFRKLGFAREATKKKSTKRGRRYYDDYLMVKFFS